MTGRRLFCPPPAGPLLSDLSIRHEPSLHHRRQQRPGSRAGAALAETGATLGLLGRRETALRELAASLPGQHRCYAVDVRDRQALHAAATDFIAFCQGRVDVVIASAGISAGTLTEHGEDYDVFKAIVDTNLLATVATFEPFVGAMRDAGGGRLVGISSVAGVRGLPGRAPTARPSQR